MNIFFLYDIHRFQKNQIIVWMNDTFLNYAKQTVYIKINVCISRSMSALFVIQPKNVIFGTSADSQTYLSKVRTNK